MHHSWIYNRHRPKCVVLWDFSYNFPIVNSFYVKKPSHSAENCICFKLGNTGTKKEGQRIKAPGYDFGKDFSELVVTGKSYRDNYTGLEMLTSVISWACFTPADKE